MNTHIWGSCQWVEGRQGRHVARVQRRQTRRQRKPKSSDYNFQLCHGTKVFSGYSPVETRPTWRHCGSSCPFQRWQERHVSQVYQGPPQHHTELTTTHVCKPIHKLARGENTHWFGDGLELSQAGSQRRCISPRQWPDVVHSPSLIAMASQVQFSS